MSPIMEHMKIENVVAYLEQAAVALGDANQRQRYAAGLLPEEEITKLARDHLFAGFAGLPRWNTREDRRDMERAFRHRAACPHTANTSKHVHGDGFDFDLATAAELTAAEWDRARQIEAYFAELAHHPWVQQCAIAITLETLSHWLSCKRCDTELVRSCVKVSVAWAGRMLTREFAL